MNSTSRENNVARLLAEVAQRVPDRPALVFQTDSAVEKITFGQLWQDAGSIAAGLKSAGLRQGDRVIIMIPMSIDLYRVLLGVIKMGAVAIFVDPWISANRIAKFAAFAEPTAFIGIGKSHLLRWMQSSLRRVPITVTTGRRIFRFPARYRLDSFRTQTADLEVAAVRADDSALITFTSGSSGEPKGANRTHRFLESQHRALAHEFPYHDNEVDMPMFPVFALNNLVSGLTSVVPQMDFRKVAEVDGDLIARQLVDFNVSTITASPPLMDRVAESLANNPDSSDRPQLRRLLTGGAPVTDAQLRRWCECYDEETEIVVAYGSTEAEPVGHIDARQRIAESGKNRGYCTGQVSKLIDARVIPIVKGVVELEGRSLEQLSLPPGEVGELVVSGSHVCRDYFRNETATRENKLLDSEGRLWHRMGDTGYFDDQQRFWLVGRVHSTIVYGQEMLHPQLLEQSAHKVSDKILQVAAIGHGPDESLKVGVVVHATDPDDQLQTQIQQQIEQDGMPCEFVLVTPAKLPVDPRHNSKIDYAKTIQQFSTELDAICRMAENKMQVGND